MVESHAAWTFNFATVVQFDWSAAGSELQQVASPLHPLPLPPPPPDDELHAVTITIETDPAATAAFKKLMIALPAKSRIRYPAANRRGLHAAPRDRRFCRWQSIVSP
jgi:hypothetical protein